MTEVSLPEKNMCTIILILVLKLNLQSVKKGTIELLMNPTNILLENNQIMFGIEEDTYLR